MKAKRMSLAALVLGAMLVPGCVFPPLISIEHKSTPASTNQDDKEVLKRLDAIDHRLAELEKKPAESTGPAK